MAKGETYEISIHAPARGATSGVVPFDNLEFISIRAPARGATIRSRIGRSSRHYFNPRTREGCDFLLLALVKKLAKFQSTHPRGVRRIEDLEAQALRMISIHAPARGATIYNGHSFFTIYISIHAPARGATYLLNSKIRRFTNFNPRTREGCDKPRRPAALHNAYFNPRTREGCDINVALFYLQLSSISIHAPARGATRHCIHTATSPIISIHAPARGATKKIFEKG